MGTLKEKYEAYEESLKVYRDLKNVQDTAFDDGEYSKALEVAQNMRTEGLSDLLIKKITGLSAEELEKLN